MHLTRERLICNTQRMRHPRDPLARQAACKLLAQGYMPGEIAEMAGVSRQLVESWGKSDGIDWRRVKQNRLRGAWRAALKRGQR